VGSPPVNSALVYRRNGTGDRDAARPHSAPKWEPHPPGSRTARPVEEQRPGPEPRWRTLLGSIRAIQMELKRCLPQHQIGLAGNPAAPESAIIVAELRLGRRLPPSYREFLAFSDGWPCFFENASLLGTGEIGRPGHAESSNQRLLAGGRLLPFGTDRAGTSLFAFDTSVRLADGELTVVAWVGGLGIDCRCFTNFLATVLQLCRAELAAVRAAEAHSVQAGSSGSKWLEVG
jgi:SMI1/KNR4 family protein SUKH-1